MRDKNLLRIGIVIMLFVAGCKLKQSGVFVYSEKHDKFIRDDKPRCMSCDSFAHIEFATAKSKDSTYVMFIDRHDTVLGVCLDTFVSQSNECYNNLIK